MRISDWSSDVCSSDLYPMMTYMVERQSDAYLKEMADYFAARHVPYPPPQKPKTTADILERGRTLVNDGDAALDVPACRACHGEQLTGVQPATPGLLGLSDRKSTRLNSSH